MKNVENKRRRFRYTPEKNIGVAFVDLLLVVVGFMLTSVMQKGTWQSAVRFSAAETAGVLLSCAFALLLFWGFEMYSAILLKPQPIIVTAILSAIYSFICTFLILLLFTRSADHILFLAVGTAVGFLLLGIWHITVYFYFKKWTHRPKMLMVERLTDDNSRVRRLKYDCMSHYDAWYEHVDVENKEHVQEFIEKVLPDYDVICLMETIPFDVRNMFMEAGLRMNKEFYVVPMTYEMNFAKVKLAYLDDVMVFHLRPTRFRAIDLVLKRAMDIVISAAALLIAFIPMCIIALLIKLTSPGPVFYKQTRLTKDAKEFEILKFRSMRTDAEKDGVARLSSGDDDDRITKTGRVIRKTRIDELPNLINIFRGDMSIVGPRAERPELAEEYQKELPEFAFRLQTKAGLTGYAQVYGKYNTEPYDKLLMDLMYIANASVFEDLRIIFATVKILFMSESTEGVEAGQTNALTGSKKDGKQ